MWQSVHLHVFFVCVAGDGVLRRWFGNGSDQKHQRKLSEGGVDRLHLQGDPQGESPKFKLVMCLHENVSSYKSEWLVETGNMGIFQLVDVMTSQCNSNKNLTESLASCIHTLNCWGVVLVPCWAPAVQLDMCTLVCVQLMKERQQACFLSYWGF